MSDLISRERLISEWDDLGRRYAMPTTPIHKRAFREFPSADVGYIKRDTLLKLMRQYDGEDLYNAILYLEDTDVSKEHVPVRFLPVNVDCRGYTDTFRCSKCGGIITTSSVTKELYYDFCPWCGGKAE